LQWLASRNEGMRSHLPEEFGRQQGGAALGSSVVDDILVQFFALGLVSRGTQRRTVSDKGKYWALTPYGEDLLMKLRAFQRD